MSIRTFISGLLGKESDDTDDSPRPRSEAEIAELRKQFEEDYAGWRPIQEERQKDIQCVSTEKGPWPEAEWQQRNQAAPKRPCLHEDVLTQFGNQVINTIEQNPRGVEVKPSGAGATIQTAEFIEGRIRQVEYEAQGQYAYNIAARNAVEGSYGFIFLDSDYESPVGSDLTLCIEAVVDPDRVIPGFSKKPDWSDLRRVWELSRITKEEFRNRWPKAKITDWNWITQQAPTWADDNTIQVCVLRYVLEEREEGNPRPKRRVFKAIFNGVEILEEVEWPDYEIPCFVVTGPIKYEKGRRSIESLYRKGRIGQLRYDFLISTKQEVIALTGKPKYKGYEGQFDTNTPWESAHRAPIAYIEAKATTEGAGSQENPLPLPVFETYEPPLAAMEIEQQSILIGIQNAIGMSSSERKDRTAKSGKALEQLSEELATGTSHFMASQHRAQERIYRTMSRVLPVLDAQRQEVSTRSYDGTQKVMAMDAAMYQGSHSVAMSAGKRYQTLQDKQEELSQQLIDLKVPEVLLAVLPDAIEMRGVGPIGTKLKAMLEAIQPPAMQAAREKVSNSQGQQPIPPQAQAEIDQAQEHLKAINAHAEQLETENGDLKEQLQAKTIESASRERIAAADNATKIQIERMKISNDQALKQKELEIEEIRLHIARESNAMKTDTDRMKIESGDRKADEDRRAAAEAARAKETPNVS